MSDAKNLMVTEIEATSGLRAVGRQRLFTIPADYSGVPTRSTSCDVTTDGERFLMARAATDTLDERPSWGAFVAQNWLEELRQLIGG